MRTVTVQILPDDITQLPAEVDAMAYGAFAVHRQMQWKEGSVVPGRLGWPWAVTHRPSGLLAAVTETQENAVRLARQLSALPIQWQKEQPMVGISKELRRQAERIADCGGRKVERKTP